MGMLMNKPFCLSVCNAIAVDFPSQLTVSSLTLNWKAPARTLLKAVLLTSHDCFPLTGGREGFQEVQGVFRVPTLGLSQLTTVFHKLAITISLIHCTILEQVSGLRHLASSSYLDVSGLPFWDIRMSPSPCHRAFHFCVLLLQVEMAFHAHADVTSLYASEAPGFHEVS